MTIRQLRTKVRVGRPSLDGCVSYGVYATKRGHQLLLVVRVGAGVAALMGWKAGTRIKLALDYGVKSRALRYLVLTEGPAVIPPYPALRVRRGRAGTLQFQETVTGVMGLSKQATKRALPDKRGSALYVPLT